MIVVVAVPVAAVMAMLHPLEPIRYVYNLNIPKIVHPLW